MNYWILKTGVNGGAFLSAVPENGPKTFQYIKGVSLKEEFPSKSDARMYFDPQHPEQVNLHDFVDNIDRLLVVNNKVKSLFDEIGVADVEYLPVTLIDHSDQIASDDYHIVNFLVHWDAIDMEKSKYRMGNIIKDRIKRIKKLVLDTEKIPDNCLLFCPSAKPNEIIVSDKLKIEIESAGLSGARFIQADGWDGMDF